MAGKGTLSQTSYAVFFAFYWGQPSYHPTLGGGRLVFALSNRLYLHQVLHIRLQCERVQQI